MGDALIIEDDWRIAQDWDSYTAEEHETWSLLYDHALKVLPGRAAEQQFKGLEALQLRREQIPNFAILSKKMKRLTGWTIVPVPGIVPDDVFFRFLANKEFPVARNIRPRKHIDYALEPDLFHDVFGHLPMLTLQVFADFLEAYGKSGIKSERSRGQQNLAALYMNTVEFGLIRTDEGLRIYGAGILSSPSECVYALKDSSPHRLAFDPARAMTTNSLYDDFQQTYFVIDSFEQLFQSTPNACWRKLAGELEGRLEYTPDELNDADVILHRGTQAYARAGGRFGSSGERPMPRYAE